MRPAIRCLGVRALLLGALAALSCALGAARPAPAQDAVDPPAPPGAAAPTSPEVPEFDRSLEGVNRARNLFERVVETYRSAPAIRDRVSISMVRVADQEYPAQTHEVPLIISREGVRIVLNDITITAVDGTLYGEYAPKPQRLYVEDFQGRLTPDLFTTQNAMFPFPHFGLTLADSPIDNLFFFTFDARLVGHRSLDDETLGAVEQVRIECSTEGAPCTLTIDPQSHLVVRFESEIRDLVNPDTGWDVRTDMQPELLDAFPVEEFVVDTDDRKQVQSMGLLTAERVTADLINTPAPEFSFDDPAGDTLTIDDCVGKATVLTFWWIASEAMSPVLDSLVAVAEWIEQEQLDAQVVPVNCANTVEDLELYLKSRELEIAQWRDPDGTTSIRSYFAPSWPTTVVISPAGKVVAAYVGTDPGDTFVQRVCNDVRRALDEDL